MSETETSRNIYNAFFVVFLCLFSSQTLFLCVCVFLYVSFFQEVFSFYLDRSLLALILAMSSGLFSGRPSAWFLALLSARLFFIGVITWVFGAWFLPCSGHGHNSEHSYIPRDVSLLIPLGSAMC